MKKQIAFCFDFDGTVTQEELLPLIAKKAGIYEEISILTKITLDGLLPFENSFKLRVKLLAGIPIDEVRAIVSQVRIDPYIQAFIRQNSADCYIVTGNLDVWIADVIETELGCQFFSSQADYQDNTLHGIRKILTKQEAVKSLREHYEQVVTIGDSMNDCSMFEAADLGIAYGGVHQPTNTLIKLSDYVVYHPKSLVNLLEQNLLHDH